ncbi:hypothetical protein [Lactiplantibacillus plantarum]|uniref:hypothetical protein n=1 Tax=Lactiplantibacillus plantarum TaxID=1590 RepID=UPI0020BEF361|nr:hypothetical protein [Lactiplantibacillus plantarum]MCK8475149.1 hypothetical protein [Lactiplantibacillus plantarum]
MEFSLLFGSKNRSYNNMLASLKCQILFLSFIFTFILTFLEFTEINNVFKNTSFYTAIKNIAYLKHISIYVFIPLIVSILWTILCHYFIIDIEMYLWPKILKILHFNSPKTCIQQSIVNTFQEKLKIKESKKLRYSDVKSTFYKFVNLDSDPSIREHYVMSALSNLEALWSILNMAIFSLILALLLLLSKHVGTCFLFVFASLACLSLALYKEHKGTKYAKDEVNAIFDDIAINIIKKELGKENAL